jgi:hypothetical protein
MSSGGSGNLSNDTIAMGPFSTEYRSPHVFFVKMLMRYLAQDRELHPLD